MIVNIVIGIAALVAAVLMFVSMTNLSKNWELLLVSIGLLTAAITLGFIKFSGSRDRLLLRDRGLHRARSDARVVMVAIGAACTAMGLVTLYDGSPPSSTSRWGVALRMLYDWGGPSLVAIFWIGSGVALIIGGIRMGPGARRPTGG